MQWGLLLHLVTWTPVVVSSLKTRGRDIQYTKWSLERQGFEIILGLGLELLVLQCRLYRFSVLCSKDKEIALVGFGVCTVSIWNYKGNKERSFICLIQRKCIPLSSIMPTSFSLSFRLRILKLDSLLPVLITESKKSLGVMKHWPPISKLANNSNL